MSVNVNRLISAAQKIAARLAGYMSRNGKRTPEKDDLSQQAALEALQLYDAANLKQFARKVRDSMRQYIKRTFRGAADIDNYDISDCESSEDVTHPALVEVTDAVYQLTPDQRDSVLAMMYGRTGISLAAHRGVSKQAVSQKLKRGLRNLRRILGESSK